VGTPGADRARPHDGQGVLLAEEPDVAKTDRRKLVARVTMPWIARHDRPGEVPRCAADDGENPATAVAGETAVPMIQTVLPETVQGCKLSVSFWYGWVEMLTRRPVSVVAAAW
jgi:hypothetical protein